MAISLYDASVTNYLQVLDAVGGFLAKSLTHLKEKTIDPQEIVEIRLYPDMLPFRYQIRSVAHHSLGALEAVKHGTFSPPTDNAPCDYATLQTLIADTAEAIRKITPEEINAREGAEVVFQSRSLKLPFKAEDFLLSFSLPNFYFHATTAYDILRSKGVPLGKTDYLGAFRMKT